MKSRLITSTRGFFLIISSLLLLILSAQLLHSFSVQAQSQTQDEDIDDLYKELEEIEKELARIRKDKQDLDEKIAGEQALQGTLAIQIRTLSNTIKKLELDIEEKETDVLKKETEIKIAEEEITDARRLIESIEFDVGELEETAGDIMISIYIDSKTNSVVDIFLASEESKSFFGQIQYHTALGKHDQNTLEELVSERDYLETQKSVMEENKLEVEKLTEHIRIEKESLEKDQEQLAAQKGQKDTLYAQSQQSLSSHQELLASLSDEEQMKLAEQTKLKQQIFNQIGKISTGQFVLKGTIIGREGQTGYAFGEHLHFTITKEGLRYWGDLSPNCSAYGCNPNPCNYLPTWGSCGISTSSIQWPMKGSYTLTSGWGERCLGGRCSYHDAIDLAYSWSQRPDNDFIFATHDGWIVYGTLECNFSLCNGNTKYAVICENKDDCNIGYKSGYYHLQ